VKENNVSHLDLIKQGGVQLKKIPSPIGAPAAPPSSGSAAPGTAAIPTPAETAERIVSDIRTRIPKYKHSEELKIFLTQYGYMLIEEAKRGRGREVIIFEYLDLPALQAIYDFKYPGGKDGANRPKAGTSDPLGMLLDAEGYSEQLTRIRLQSLKNEEESKPTGFFADLASAKSDSDPPGGDNEDDEDSSDW
jgi:hypothetical protein